MKRGKSSPLPLWEMAYVAQAQARQLSQAQSDLVEVQASQKLRHHDARNLVMSAKRLMENERVIDSKDTLDALLDSVSAPTQFCFLNELQRRARAWRAAAKVKVVIKLSPSVPENDARLELLLRCADNLVQNAIEATHHGQIRIQIWGQTTLRLNVADTGGGLAPKTSGLGIGLSLIHQKLAFRRGTLEINSVRGAGVTARVKIPNERRKADRIQPQLGYIAPE